MRSLKPILLFSLLTILSTNSLEAQLLKKLKKRVQEATEDVIAEKAAQKVAQESGKALDSLLEIDPDYQAKYPEHMAQMMAAGSENIPIEDSYTFNTMVNYEMTITDGDNSSEVNYEMWFSENAPYMATQVNNNAQPDPKDMPSAILSILDDKNQAMIIVMEEQKMAQLLSMSKIKNSAIAESEEEETDTAFEALTKTGNSKQILGYTCEEFVSENESGKLSFWVTTELTLFQKNMFFNMSQSLGGNTFGEIPSEARGFMMEMNYEDLSSKEKSKMQVVDIKNETKEINMMEYQRMNLGQFMQK